MKKLNQKAFTVVEFVAIILVLAVVAGAGYFAYNKVKSNEVTSSSPEKAGENSEVKIKHLGVNLDTYNPSTNMAGDFEFTKEDMAFNLLFFEYGFEVPANSAGPAKKNPQPTFILPLGTKVHSLVDGVVYDVPELYSKDYSVRVQGEGSDLIFETEHVINVKVKKGDKVKAGDVIAEVSDYDVKNYAGLGLVEIGVLKAGNPPSHVCPFDYLDDSIEDSTFKNITALKKSWEDYRGDSTIYNESNEVVPGCLTREPIEG